MIETTYSDTKQRSSDSQALLGMCILAQWVWTKMAAHRMLASQTLALNAAAYHQIFNLKSLLDSVYTKFPAAQHSTVSI